MYEKIFNSFSPDRIKLVLTNFSTKVIDIVDKQKLTVSHITARFWMSQPRDCDVTLSAPFRVCLTSWQYFDRSIDHALKVVFNSELIVFGFLNPLLRRLGCVGNNLLNFIIRLNWHGHQPVLNIYHKRPQRGNVNCFYLFQGLKLLGRKQLGFSSV